MAGCADGLVIGADSRSTIAGKYFDDSFKIHIPATPPRTAFVVTGTGESVAWPPAHVTDLAGYIKSAPRLLSIPATVGSFLATMNGAVSSMSVPDLAAQCIADVRRFKASDPDGLRSFSGKDLCAVVVAGYDPDTRVSCVRKFVAHISATDQEPSIVGETDYIISPHRPENLSLNFGECDYLIKHVVRGAGRFHLQKQTIEFRTLGKSPSAVSLDEAVAHVTDIINTTSKMTDIVPAPTGIGGPVDIVLLGKDPAVQKLRWKGQTGSH
jgi:hypothetical protein